MGKAVTAAWRTSLATLAVCAVGLGIAACKGPQEETARAAPAPAAPAKPAAPEIEYVSADGQVVADPNAAPTDAGPQAKPDADWPLGDLGYGDYELGERYSYLVNQLSARGVAHKVEYDSSYAHKSLKIPQTALGSSWDLRLAFDSTAEKVFAMDLSHTAADAPACEQQFTAALDKMTAVAGFAPTLEKASGSTQTDRYRWGFRNGNRLQLTRNCTAAPYAVSFRLEKGVAAGV